MLSNIASYERLRQQSSNRAQGCSRRPINPKELFGGCSLLRLKFALMVRNPLDAYLVHK